MVNCLGGLFFTLCYYFLKRFESYIRCTKDLIFWQWQQPSSLIYWVRKINPEDAKRIYNLITQRQFEALRRLQQPSVHSRGLVLCFGTCQQLAALFVLYNGKRLPAFPLRCYELFLSWAFDHFICGLESFYTNKSLCSCYIKGQCVVSNYKWISKGERLNLTCQQLKRSLILYLSAF